MRRKILLIVLLVLGILYLQFGRKPTVNNITTHSDPSGYTADITITVNKLGIFNRDGVEESLTRDILDNDFHNMLLSYDIMGYPTKVNVTVYSNNLAKNFGDPTLKFTFSPDIAP